MLPLEINDNTALHTTANMSSPTNKAASQDPVTSEMLSSRESDQSTQKGGADDSHGLARETEGDTFPEKQSENEMEKNEK